MLQPSTLSFLKNLKKNNNKPWFDSNRKIYDAAKSDFISLVDELIEGITQFDASLTGLTAKNCIFRINKDVRFSKDKSPYKTNMGASFTTGGKKISAAGYYFHLEPVQSFIAGGFYMPMPPQLASIRQEIDYNFEEWNSIISKKSFKKIFTNGVEGVSSLARPPKGYDANNPAIDFLKMKGFIVSAPLSDKELSDKGLKKKVIQVFKEMKPMIDFLNRAVE